MADNDLTPLWNRIDQHGTALKDQEAELKIAKDRLDRHDSEFRKMSKDISDQHSTIIHKIEAFGKEITTDIKELKADYQRRQGAGTAFKTIVVVVGLVSTVLGIFYMLNGGV